MFAESTHTPAHHQFHAMGTTVDLWLWDGADGLAVFALKEAERIFERAEARFSRFRTDSELSALNRSAGKPFVASPELFRLVSQALRWREKTGGLFDPTILPALKSAGYDRSFEQIERAPSSPSPQKTTAPAGAKITIADWNQRITLVDPNTEIDLGGIAKSWTAQQALNYLGKFGAAMVDAGGDIVCTAPPSPLNPWLVSVDGAEYPLLLDAEAVATSSTAHRRWTQNGTSAHHIIDPRTGKPARTDLVSVTVVAATLTAAEIHAKVALVLGADDGTAYLESVPEISAQVLLNDGTRRTVGAFQEKQLWLHTQLQAE